MSRPPRRLFAFLFWLCVDRFGLILGINLVCLLLCLPVLTAPLALAGGAHVSRLLMQTRNATVGDFWAGLRKYALRSYFFCILLAVLWFWCLVAIGFYASLSVFWMAIGVCVALAFALFLAGLTFWAIPHVFSEVSFKQAVKAALRDLLLYPAKTLLFFLILGLGKFLLTISGVGVFVLGFLWPLMLAFYAQNEIAGRHLEERRGLKDFFMPRADDGIK